MTTTTAHPEARSGRHRAWGSPRELRVGAHAVARSVVFILKMFPIPLRLVDWVTRTPVIETVTVRTPSDPFEADLYRPRSRGPHPGMVVSLGVLPRGVVDPRAAQLGEALARAGFAALLHWSPSARDLRLDPDDLPLLVAAYEALLERPSVDASRSGLMGVCVGGSFALIAAADPAVRQRVRFVVAHAPYGSLWTLAVDIASGTQALGDRREPWDVDPLTWQVWVRSVTDWLEPTEAARLRSAYEERIAWNADKTVIIRSPARESIDPAELSDDGRAVLRLLAAGADDIQDALLALPSAAQRLLAALSPLTSIGGVAAPLIVLLHDRDDHVIPVGESRRLWSAIRGRPGAAYTETGLRHLRVPRGWSPLRMARESLRAYRAWYPLFRETTA